VSAAMTHAAFPPPWSVEEQEACFVVRDHDGQALAYVYSSGEINDVKKEGGPLRRPQSFF
jgi:hypothetical protein